MKKTVKIDTFFIVRPAVLIPVKALTFELRVKLPLKFLIFSALFFCLEIEVLLRTPTSYKIRVFRVVHTKTVVLEGITPCSLK
jgi:hypothetical protein